MAPSDNDSGITWVILVAASFGIGFALAKMKMVNYTNATRFCTWVSGVVAALVALAADSGNGGASELGRLGIFVVVWLAFGLVFTMGVLMGIEKANKR